MEAGWPLLDLLYLIDHVAFAAAGARTVAARVRAAREVRAGAGPVGVAGRGAIRDYLGSLALDPAIVPPLRGLCAAVHALSEHRRLVEVRPTPSADELARGLFWALWHLDAPGA